MPYAPSPWRVNKYKKYGQYALEILKRNDYQSFIDSFKYVLFKKLPARSRVVETALGRFRLRSQTTDFQFVNFTYENEIRRYLTHIGDQIGLFIDVGSCIGEYAIWLGSKGIKCIAIEPVNYAAIEENIRLNGDCAGNVEVQKCAVGKETTTVSFYMPEGVTSSSFMNKDGQIGDIPCRRLDDLIDLAAIDQNRITVIKLDVEGMELEALEGATGLLRGIRNLQIVYEYTSLKDEVIRAFLNQYATFDYTDLDNVNTLAVKVV
jgi:FkbM family methyltransferase